MLKRDAAGFDAFQQETPSRLRVCCVIPAYRAADTVTKVVSEALRHADDVVVVDDRCPELSGKIVREAFRGTSAVHVIERDRNGGVGAAMKTGIASAIELGADVIVKIDADGQMDPAYIDTIRTIFQQDPALLCIKGNRFFNSSVLRLMPKNRLFGNAILSLLAKCASGYWNIIDPTNGYLAFNAGLLKLLDWESFADSYFFEISVLCELGLKRLPILELEMPTIYTAAPSSLSIRRVLFEFPQRLVGLTLRRLLLQYFVFDINLGTLYGSFGLLLALFGLAFGGFEWAQSIMTHTPRTTGTVMLAVLPFLMGFQLLLNALMYDVEFSKRTSHELLVNARGRWPAHEYRNSNRD